MIDLSKTTILIHAMNDHPDRVRNLRVVLKWLRKYFHVKIILLVNIFGELDYSWAGQYVDDVITVNDKVSWPTKYTNVMARRSKTEFIANWIHDVVLDTPKSALVAQGMLESGCDIVFPYENSYYIGGDANGRRDHEIEEFEERLEFDLDKLPSYQNRRLNVGYIFMARAESFWRAGGLNENFVMYSPEDKERLWRWRKLDFRIERTPNRCLHLYHWRPEYDGIENEYYVKNDIEYKRICAMSREELEKEISKWPWMN